MKTRLRSIALAHLLTLAAAPTLLAQYQNFITPAAGPYVRIDAGGSVMHDNHLGDFAGLTSGNAVSYDAGVAFNAAFGFAFNSWVAVELESGWTWNSINSIEGFETHDTSFSTAPILANVVLQHQIPRTLLVPYVGVGVGGAITVFDTDGLFYPRGGLGFSGSDSDFVFAYQAFAGVRLEINPKMHLGIGYKYYATEKSTFGEDSDFFGHNLRLELPSQSMHLVTVSFNMKF